MTKPGVAPMAIPTPVRPKRVPTAANGTHARASRAGSGVSIHPGPCRYTLQAAAKRASQRVKSNSCRVLNRIAMPPF
jgi:hypothetical protein